MRCWTSFSDWINHSLNKNKLRSRINSFMKDEMKIFQLQRNQNLRGCAHKSSVFSRTQYIWLRTFRRSRPTRPACSWSGRWWPPRWSPRRSPPTPWSARRSPSTASRAASSGNFTMKMNILFFWQFHATPKCFLIEIIPNYRERRSFCVAVSATNLYYTP